MLERKPRTGGKADVVDHAPNMHDDAANATCGALWLAGASKGGSFFDMTPEQVANYGRTLQAMIARKNSGGSF